MTHYDTLGVPKDADSATIKRAYRKKARKAHPDRDGGQHRDMVALNRAYDTLSDPTKRARYDQTGKEEAPQPSIDIQARQSIMQLFSKCMDALGDTDDHVEAVRFQVRGHQRQILDEIGKLRKVIQKLEKRRNRVRFKGEGINFLADLLNQRIVQATAAISNMEEGSKVAERALEILKDFEYEAEKRAAPFGFGSDSGSMFVFSE